MHHPSPVSQPHNSRPCVVSRSCVVKLDRAPVWRRCANALSALSDNQLATSLSLLAAIIDLADRVLFRFCFAVALNGHSTCALSNCHDALQWSYAHFRRCLHHSFTKAPYFLGWHPERFTSVWFLFRVKFEAGNFAARICTSVACSDDAFLI